MNKSEFATPFGISKVLPPEIDVQIFAAQRPRTSVPVGVFLPCQPIGQGDGDVRSLQGIPCAGEVLGSGWSSTAAILTPLTPVRCSSQAAPRSTRYFAQRTAALRLQLGAVCWCTCGH